MLPTPLIVASRFRSRARECCPRRCFRRSRRSRRGSSASTLPAPLSEIVARRARPERRSCRRLTTAAMMSPPPSPRDLDRSRTVAFERTQRRYVDRDRGRIVEEGEPAARLHTDLERSIANHGGHAAYGVRVSADDDPRRFLPGANDRGKGAAQMNRSRSDRPAAFPTCRRRVRQARPSRRRARMRVPRRAWKRGRTRDGKRSCSEYGRAAREVSRAARPPQ